MPIPLGSFRNKYLITDIRRRPIVQVNTQQAEKFFGMTWNRISNCIKANRPVKALYRIVKIS